MLLTIGVVLLVLWLLGFMLLKKVVGAFIHIVLIIAICAIIWHFVSGQ
jgi:Family of unknown function (DUF5670)